MKNVTLLNTSYFASPFSKIFQIVGVGFLNKLSISTVIVFSKSFTFAYILNSFFVPTTSDFGYIPGAFNLKEFKTH